MKNIPLAAGILFLAAGGFLIWSRQDRPAVTTQPPSLVSTTTTAATPHPHIFGDVPFDPKTVAVGDQYGIFKVTDASYIPATNSYPDAIYSVGFSGTMTIVGTYGRAPEMGCFIPLENIPTSTAQQLPRTTAAGTYIPHSLELAVDAIPQADEPMPGDKVEVTINRFVSASVPKTCGGDYAVVTSIKKI